ncbi:MAG: ribosome biogenesis GTPase Der [Candidatus Cloacimonadota bacterium]|nr:MAG: ribosome biogenesis GTPase Der [Candidatus Cloacimonadota bacterium]
MMNVVIVGRPNVGKSTLFNRIIRQRKAVVEAVSGVTRDRLLQRAEWGGKSFYITDTGGYIPSETDRITTLVAQQVDLAIEDGHIILFTVNEREGLTPLDREIAESLRKNGKIVILVVNKVDNLKREQEMVDFYGLGFKKVFPVSSIHGRGVADLLEEIITLIPEEQSWKENDRTKLAIIGIPNLGKSSFFNRIINEERVIVDEKPGTTRDAIDTEIEFEGEQLTIIDTAGIRRKPRITTDLEYYTIKRAISTLLECDIALVMVDGSVDITRQDKRLIALAGRSAGTIVILLNKMDLVPRKLWNDALHYFRNALVYIPSVLTVPISAKNGDGVFDALRIALDAHTRSSLQMDNQALNELIANAVHRSAPKRVGKKKVYIYGCRQVSRNPPCLVVYTSHPDDITRQYQRYLEKKVREHFSLQGIPLVMKFQKRGRGAKRHEKNDSVKKGSSSRK